jgi:ribosomal protein L40E
MSEVMFNCLECGHPNPRGTANCRACGASLPVTDKGYELALESRGTALNKCPKCGTANPLDATNCKECGINLEWAKEHLKAKCPTCGAENPPGATNCQQCGVKLTWEAEVQKKAAEVECKEANDALIAAIVGILCFGIFLEPYALYKANQAKNIIAANPGMKGGGKATAAMIIAIVVLVIWVLYVIGVLAQM